MTDDKIRAKVQIGILKPASEVFEAIVDPDKMSRRRRADEHGRPGGAHVPPPHRQGSARVLRRARGGLQVHRGRPDDLGHAARPDLPPNLPARTRGRVSASDDRAYQGRPLGDGEPRQSAGRRREADRSDGEVRHRAGQPARRTAKNDLRSAASCQAPHPDKASRDQAMEAVTRFVRAFTYENIPWREAQQVRECCGRRCASHTRTRSTRTGSSGAASPMSSIPCLASRSAMRRRSGLARPPAGRRGGARHASTRTPPRSIARYRAARQRSTRRPRPRGAGQASPRGKPFALDGVRVLDFTWFLASAGGTRFLSFIRRGMPQGRARRAIPTRGSPPWPRSAAARRA